MLPPIKNQRRPNRSDSRPRMVYVNDRASVRAMLTHDTYGLGPMSALMYVRMFVGNRRNM